jgi:hypothetical protein
MMFRASLPARCQPPALLGTDDALMPRQQPRRHATTLIRLCGRFALLIFCRRAGFRFASAADDADYQLLLAARHTRLSGATPLMPPQFRFRRRYAAPVDTMLRHA